MGFPSSRPPAGRHSNAMAAGRARYGVERADDAMPKRRGDEPRHACRRRASRAMLDGSALLIQYHRPTTAELVRDDFAHWFTASI